MKFHGLMNCDTCRKAMKMLEASGRDVEMVDIRGPKVGRDEISGWLEAVGPDVLVNRRSTSWRNLDDAQKEAAMGEGALDLLTGNPTLIKRPVIEDGDTVHVGWSPAVQKALL